MFNAEDQASAPHRVFGPSASHGWMNCPGSIWAQIGLPDNAGVDAAEGTIFHELMEEWLNFGEPTHWLNTVREADGFKVVVSHEMMQHARDCYEWVKDIPGESHVEVRVDYSNLTPIPHQGGTCDLAFCSPGLLVVRDWKYGMGVPVRAEGNTQLMLYAYGAYRHWNPQYNFERISIGIGQPRHERFESIEMTVEELKAFARTAKAAAHLAWQKDAPRVPGEKQCRFCKARGNCEARQRAMEDIVDGAFDVVEYDVHQERERQAPRAEPIPAGQLSTDQLVAARRWRKTMEQWFKDVEAELQGRIHGGETPAGLKTVEGRKKKRWRNPQATDQFMRRLGLQTEQLYSMKFLSPNNADKKLIGLGVPKKTREKLFNALVETIPGKPTLVFEGDDDREALEDDGEVFD